MGDSLGLNWWFLTDKNRGGSSHDGGKWLIIMVILSPVGIGLFPFQMACDLIAASDTWEPILQAILNKQPHIRLSGYLLGISPLNP